MKKIKSVCVYCASSSKINPRYFEAARETGRLLAQNGMRCVCGAGNQGLMGTLADSVLNDKEWDELDKIVKASLNSFLENGGEVLGVIPRFMIDEGWCHKGLTETIVTADMHERKERMAQEADAVIALPGGCGTMEELFEIITWKQLGLFLNPIVILNIDGYYNPLIEMLHNAIGENFMRQEHARMWQVAQTPQEAVDAIQNMPVWDKNIRKIAAI